ncbi:MAG: PQQ-dependent sugar dehydrogenase [Pseudomonadota bacterium]
MPFPRAIRAATCSAILSLGAALPAAAQENARMEVVVSGLDAPWGIAPLADGRVLITEKSGTLLLAGPGGTNRVSGTPSVQDRGQGGLLDITLARDFEQTRELFLTYAKPQRGGAGTALAKARLSDDGSRLENLTELFEAAPGFGGGRHFGSRVVEAPDGTLFVTIGDRGDRPSAQDRSNHNGAIVRVNRDGTVPTDNPFLGQSDVLPEIWSYGHRNPQGAGLDLNGNLWTAEHGARGGDEVNAVKKGANFGWPVISYGVHYSGGKIGEGTAKAGMEQPEFYWDPSMAPSGLMVYSGKMFPAWRGDIFVGSLKFDYIARLEGSPLREVAQIKNDATLRVRDIVEGPDGAIWFISVGNGSVYRLTAS